MALKDSKIIEIRKVVLTAAPYIPTSCDVLKYLTSVSFGFRNVDVYVRKVLLSLFPLATILSLPHFLSLEPKKMLTSLKISIIYGDT